MMTKKGVRTLSGMGSSSTLSTTDKVTENRLRRAADRRGLMLVKCRRRDPGALGYGRYVLVRASAGNMGTGGQAAISAFANGEGMTLDQIAAELGV